MSRGLVILAACGLLVAAGSPASGAERTARHDGRIVFDACSDVGCDIYTANPDGTAVRQVTHDGASFYADWSPDGRRIVYSNAAGDRTSIWIADASGANARQLTPDDPDADNLWPRFSADGRLIYYTNCFGFDCDGGISAIRPDGTGQHAITPNSGDSYNIGAPSPDGSRLAFMRWHVNGVKMRIYVKRLTGPRPRPEIALTPPALEGWAPDWSPSGSAVLFSSNLFANRPNGAIYELNLDATSHTQQIRKVTRPPFPLEDWAGAYSPAGDRIVFTSDRRYPGRGGADLYVVRRDGTDVHRVVMPALDGMYTEWPRWGTAALQPASAGSAAQTPSPGRLCVNATLRSLALLPALGC
jgi:Tol biopolymer transport system component